MKFVRGYVVRRELILRSQRKHLIRGEHPIRVPEKNSSRDSRKPVLKTTVDKQLTLEKQFNRAGTQFLKVDVATALTFAETALGTQDAAKKRRNRKSARKAYDTVVRMAKKVTLSDQDSKELERGLHRLRANLRRLGETF